MVKKIVKKTSKKKSAFNPWTSKKSMSRRPKVQGNSPDFANYYKSEVAGHINRTRTSLKGIKRGSALGIQRAPAKVKGVLKKRKPSGRKK